MSTYAIGDLQGCYRELEDLLNKINYDPTIDKLWLAGDIVNRGPESLKCLRFAQQHDILTVLGNHDLYLLAIEYGSGELKAQDTLDAIFSAPDKDDLLTWLQSQPLVHMDHETGYALVHAGLPPQWSIKQAITYANEVEEVLRGSNARIFFQHMYGNLPDRWSDKLKGWDRLRYITNALTRIRYCYPDGQLDFSHKDTPDKNEKSLIPWYRTANRKSHETKIIFGHWASLGVAQDEDFTLANVFPVDKGCVWGRQLAAMRLEDGKYFDVPSRQPIA